MATSCRILYKGEYYEKNEFQTLMQDPIFREQVRVSVLTDEFMKMWSDPANKSMSAVDIVNALGSRGLASLNTNSEIQKIKAELVERDQKGLRGDGKPIETTAKAQPTGPTVRWYTGLKIPSWIRSVDERLFSGVMRSRLPGVYEAFQDVRNRINVEMIAVNKLTDRLNKFMSDNKSLLTKDDILSVSAVVQGAGMDRLLLPKVTDPTKADALRQELFDIASKMRMHIDNLSAELVNSGYIKEAGVDIYLNNLGKYTARVYEAHLNPESWWDKLTGSDPNMAYIFNRGKNFIRGTLENQYIQLDDTLKSLNKEINELLAKQRNPSLGLTSGEMARLQKLQARATQAVAELDKINRGIDLINNDLKSLNKEINNLLAKQRNPNATFTNADAVKLNDLQTKAEELGAVLKETKKGKNLVEDRLDDLNKEINDLLAKQRNPTFTKADTIRLETLQMRAAQISTELKKIDEYLNDEAKFEEFVKESVLGSGGDIVTPGEKRINIDLGLFKKRKDIPEEIRALMGEITDPATLYATTIKRMASFLGKYNFQLNFAIEGDGVLFSLTPDKEKGFTEKISVAKMPAVRDALGLKSDGYIYVPAALVDEISGVTGADGNDNAFSRLLEALSWINGLAKATATKYSPMSHLRNFVGASAFLISNGYLFSRQFWTSLSVIMAELKNSTTETAGFDTRSDLMTLVRELSIKTGVLNSNVEVEEIKELLKDSRLTRWMNGMSEKINKNEKINSITSSKLFDNITSLPSNAYEGTDNLFKLAGFLAEMNRLAPLYGYKSFEQMFKDLGSSDQAKVAKAQDAVDKLSSEAGRLIRGGMPNYTEAWKFNAILKRIPFIGVFTTFMSETIRTSANSVIYFTEAVENSIKDPDPARRKVYAEIAASRLLGLTIALSVTAFQEELRSVLADIIPDDEEDEEEKKKLKGKDKYVDVNGRDTFMKYYVPEWVKGVDLRRDPYNPDGYIYSDPSTINPFSLFRRRVAERQIGDNKFTMLTSLISPILEPIFSPEIGFNFLVKLFSGKDMYDEDITPYEFADNPILWGKDMAAYLQKAPIVPWSNAVKLFGAEQSRLDTRIRNDEELLSKTTNLIEREKIQDRIRQNQYKLQQSAPVELFLSLGYKSNYVDLSTQAGFKTYEVAEKIQEYKKRYSKKKGEAEDIDALYEETNKSYQKDLKKLRDMVLETKKSLGVDVTESVVKALTNSRFSKKEILYIKGYSKEAPDIRIKDYETRRG